MYVSSLFLVQHINFDLNSNLQRIAARQEFWNSKLEQLDQQRDRISQNTVNSIHVAQQTFSPEVLLATNNNKPSSKLLHMQRKVASSRSSCNFNLARKLEDEMQIMLVQHRVS
jgi:exonuclease VII large subunit